MPIVLSTESVTSYAECPGACAKINAGFGCIGADDSTIRDVSDKLVAAGAHWAYIGLHEKKVGEWVWADATCSTKTKDWKSGEPGMNDNEHCAGIMKEDTSGWHDFTCCNPARCACDSDLAPWSEEEFCQDSCGTDDPTNQDTLCVKKESSVSKLSTIKLLLLTLLFTACSL